MIIFSLSLSQAHFPKNLRAINLFIFRSTDLVSMKQLRKGFVHDAYLMSGTV